LAVPSPPQEWQTPVPLHGSHFFFFICSLEPCEQVCISLTSGLLETESATDAALANDIVRTKASAKTQNLKIFLIAYNFKIAQRYIFINRHNTQKCKSFSTSLFQRFLQSRHAKEITSVNKWQRGTQFGYPSDRHDNT
jgi:hypothetical protein